MLAPIKATVLKPELQTKSSKRNNFRIKPLKITKNRRNPSMSIPDGKTKRIGRSTLL